MENTDPDSINKKTIRITPQPFLNKIILTHYLMNT